MPDLGISVVKKMMLRQQKHFINFHYYLMQKENYLNL